MNSVLKVFVVGYLCLIWKVCGQEINEDYKRELQSSIRKQLELMNVKVNDNKISKEIMIKVMKRIYSGDYSKINANYKDDKDMINIFSELFKEVPGVIDVDEVWKYINPMKMERIFNAMLNGFELSKIIGNINTHNNKVTNDL